MLKLDFKWLLFKFSKLNLWIFWVKNIEEKSNKTQILEYLGRLLDNEEWKLENQNNEKIEYIKKLMEIISTFKEDFEFIDLLISYMYEDIANNSIELKDKLQNLEYLISYRLLYDIKDNK